MTKEEFDKLPRLIVCSGGSQVPWPYLDVTTSEDAGHGRTVGVKGLYDGPPEQQLRAAIRRAVE